MRYNLAQMAARARKTRRREIPIRPILSPATQASDLYASVYAPIVKGWTEALPNIMAAYERALAQMTTDDAEDIGARIEQVESSLTSVFLKVKIALGTWSARSERWHRSRWASNVLTATGVEIGTMIGPEGVKMTTGAAIERNVSLVRSVSDETRRRIADAVFRGLNKRAPARDVAREITEAVGMSRKRALRIAADQSVKISRQLNEERRREAGITTWEWVHSGKAHPREEHVARDGKRFDDDNPPLDMPGELPFCGCTSRAVLNLDEYI